MPFLRGIVAWILKVVIARSRKPCCMAQEICSMSFPRKRESSIKRDKSSF
ncbi:MAG TPA: hypothetical protein LFV92_02990 [Rickettsia endosymbiont of Ceroptres masudai]|nr:hypothetical protein [Rickettsia endosymbiont of Ceroptres masudai]